MKENNLHKKIKRGEDEKSRFKFDIEENNHEDIFVEESASDTQSNNNYGMP